MRSTGTLLVAAFLVFGIGAGFWLVREFEQPLQSRLRAVAAHHRRWMWIHLWMMAGTLVGVCAIASLARLLRDDGAGVSATVAAVLFAAGGLALLPFLMFEVTTTHRTAMSAASTGVVPPSYPARQRAASALYVGHMLLSYATFAVLGFAMLRVSLLPPWLGWTGVGAGVVGLIGFSLMRGGPFGPPIIAHSFGLLVGIVLLVQG